MRGPRQSPQQSSKAVSYRGAWGPCLGLPRANWVWSQNSQLGGLVDLNPSNPSKPLRIHSRADPSAWNALPPLTCSSLQFSLIVPPCRGLLGNPRLLHEPCPLQPWLLSFASLTTIVTIKQFVR